MLWAPCFVLFFANFSVCKSGKTLKLPDYWSALRWEGERDRIRVCHSTLRVASLFKKEGIFRFAPPHFDGPAFFDFFKY